MKIPAKLLEGNKRKLALILCMAVALCGCGKSVEIQNTETAMKESGVEAAEEKLSGESENVTGETIESGLEQQEAEKEDQYAIYERFMDGEEPLYFPRGLNALNLDGTGMIEEGSSYNLAEICNKINRYDNYRRAVNEMEQLSYAYIDCGADGQIELALLFDDLSYWDNGGNSEVLIIKNIDGRLEMCYVLSTTVGGWAEISNEYGVITNGHSDMFSEYEQVGYIDEDGNYVYLYHKDMENWGYGMLDEYEYSDLYDSAKGYDLDYIFVVNQYGFEPAINYPDYEDYLADAKYSFGLRDMDSGEEILVEDTDPSIYVNDDFLALLDKAGISFYSPAKIDDMILDRAREIGLTEEMLNGKPIQWIPFEEKDYHLLYGVEKAEGISDLERAMEAYRRFLSDRGHFKEILSHTIGDIEICFGMVDGFFIKDMDGDSIPELLIEMAEHDTQALFIYAFDTDSGRVKLDQIIDAYECVVDWRTYPNGTDGWLLYGMRANGPILFGYNSADQLIWFDQTVDADDGITVYWCDYPGYGSNLTAHYYYEYIDYEDIDSLYGEIKSNSWELEGVHASREEAEKVLAGYKPFLFYDVTPENIEKYVNVNYLSAGMENYDIEDVISDKEAFEELRVNIQDMYSQHMLSGVRFHPYEENEYPFRYVYNLDYLIQFYDRFYDQFSDW